MSASLNSAIVLSHDFFSAWVRVVNKDPDNLLVQWVPGGMTITEILKEMSSYCGKILYT